MVEPDCGSRDSGGRSGIGLMTLAAVAAALGCSCGVSVPLSMTGRKCEDEVRETQREKQ